MDSSMGAALMIIASEYVPLKRSVEDTCLKYERLELTHVAVLHKTCGRPRQGHELQQVTSWRAVKDARYLNL